MKTEKAHQEKRGYPNRGEGGRGHREPDLYQFRKRSVVWKTYPFFIILSIYHYFQCDKELGHLLYSVYGI